MSTDDNRTLERFRAGEMAAFAAFVPGSIPVLFYDLWPGRAPCFAASEIAMKTHVDLRSFLTGAFVPTLVLPRMFCVLVGAWLELRAPAPIGRAATFFIALLPQLWVLWSMLWRRRMHAHIWPSDCTAPCVLIAPVFPLPSCGQPPGGEVPDGLYHSRTRNRPTGVRGLS